MLAFLGTPGSDAQVRDAVAYAAYDNMKQLEDKRVFWLSGLRLRPGDRANPQSYKVRRAKVGGWRDYFDDGEVAAIDALARGAPEAAVRLWRDRDRAALGLSAPGSTFCRG